MNRVIAILPSKVLYGKERSNIEVYNLLIENGYDFSLIINKKANNKLLNYTSSFSPRKLIIPDRHHQRYRLLRYILEFIVANIILLLVLLKEKPTKIFLCSELTFYDFCIALTLSRAQIIYRIGDAPAYPKLSNYSINSRIWNYLVCKKTDTCIFISKYIREQVVKHGRKNPKDIVIYNYPPARNTQQTDESSKYMKTDRLRFGYIGQIIDEKGVALLFNAAIDILRKSDDAIFYIAGSLSYDSAFAKTLLERHEQFELKERLIFLDEIDDIKLFFENIDVLIVPSLKEEPLGNVLVEAKAFSTPCIIFKSGGMPELIRHRKDGYVCEASTTENIVEAIEYYLAHPENIKPHGENALASITELEIDYKSFKQKWESVF